MNGIHKHQNGYGNGNGNGEAAKNGSALNLDKEDLDTNSGINYSTPATGLRRTRGFYVAMLVAGAVWLVTPASWLTVLYYFVLRPLRSTAINSSSGSSASSLLSRCMPSSHAPILSKFWYYYAIQEVPFSIYLRYVMRQAQRPRPLPKTDVNTLERLLTKCLEVGLPKEQVKRAEKEAANHLVQRHTNSAQNGGSKRSKEEEDLIDRQLGGSSPSNSGGQKKLQGVAAFKDRLIPKEEADEQRERLRVWFHYAPLEELYADNVREWLAWAFAGRELDQVKANKELAQLVEVALEMTKLRLQWSHLQEGYNPRHKPLRLTIDPVKVLHRPLGHYMVVNSVTALTIAWLRVAHGFRYEHVGRCSFLVKPRAPAAATSTSSSAPSHSNGDTPEPLPILFLHGLGIGIGQYQRFLQRLARHRDGVVIMIQPHISAGIYSPDFLEPPGKDEQAQATIEVLKRHNMERVTVLSHSNGTMVAGWLLRAAPEMCARNILVDPVSFCLWQGSVCYAFVYRQWATFIEVLLGYFVAREVGVAHTIGRCFIWSDMALWADELPTLDPKDTHFVFGEKDL